MNTTTPRTPPKTPNAIVAIRAGERVGVSLRSASPASYEVWHGTILAVDAIGLRLRAELLRTDYGRFDEDGVRFFPWAAIESVEVQSNDGEPS